MIRVRHMGNYQLTTQHTLSTTLLTTVYIFPWHIKEFIQQHTIYFWTPCCVVLTWTRRWHGGPSWANRVIKVRHFLDLWCFQGNWELRTESWWRHWSSGRKSSWLTFQSRMTVQNVFPNRSMFFPLSPVVLNSLKSSFRNCRGNFLYLPNHESKPHTSQS